MMMNKTIKEILIQYISDNQIPITIWQVVCNHYFNRPVDLIRSHLAQEYLLLPNYSDDELREALKSFLYS